jgi:hypothetical protein
LKYQNKIITETALESMFQLSTAFNKRYSISYKLFSEYFIMIGLYSLNLKDMDITKKSKKYLYNLIKDIPEIIRPNVVEFGDSLLKYDYEFNIKFSAEIEKQHNYINAVSTLKEFIKKHIQDISEISKDFEELENK